MPDTVARFTISVPPELLSSFDDVSTNKGYSSRSEAVRDALRDYLVAHNWNADGTGSDGTGEVVGTITLVYDHEMRRLNEELLDRQHRHHTQVLSTLHIHLDPKNCLEVIVVRGKRQEIMELADSLISLRGVKFGRLVNATTGAGLA